MADDEAFPKLAEMSSVTAPIKDIARRVLERVSPSLMQARYIRNATGRELEVCLLPLLCRPDSKALDVGANRGLYTHHLLPLADEVVAFEPLPSMRHWLRHAYGSRVRIEPVALSDHEGSAPLRMPNGISSWATLAESNKLELADAAKGFAIVETQVRTLDSYDLNKVGFMKIDVEGYEEVVLRGAERTLRRETPNLLIEVEERHNRGSVERVADMLAELGYQGLFVSGYAVKPIADFDLASDQPISHVGQAGKQGHYINNFIFVPDLLSEQFAARATRLLDGCRSAARVDEA